MPPTQTGHSRLWIRGLAPGIIIALGVLHSAIGVSGGWETLVDIAQSRFWNTVHSDDGPPSRSLVFWFLSAGFMLIIVGHLAFWVERTLKRPLPAIFAIELMIFAVVGGIATGGGAVAFVFAGVAIYIWLNSVAALPHR